MYNVTQHATYETKNIRETAVLIGVHAQTDRQFNFESTMEELDALSQTCQLNVKGQITQNREQFDHKYYVGKGKIDEIKSFIEFHDIDVVVTNDELTTAQSKTLNDNLGIKIIDRTQLILEIFALRARSRLEMDRRHIRTRMNEIKHQLKTVVDHRERYRNKREQNQVFQIALVGYTNAGKSSWFNVLANEETYEKNILFATLDPKTRQIQVNEGFNLIISDTVGFIQKLPTTLVAAFKSTLEEAKGADILMHVVDASHSEYRTQIDTVNQIINDLEMDHIPQVVIFNKKDLCNEQMDVPVSKSAHVFVSSRDENDK
ncbi:MAG: GTPase HflX, partial [Staphylococcus epidermidis]|nr:GTPase HflX [Staphylococcus epidermidis]